MKYELNSCSFCGGQLYLDIDDEAGGAGVYHAADTHCIIPDIDTIDDIPVGSTIDDLVARINRRPIDAQSATIARLTAEVDTLKNERDAALKRAEAAENLIDIFAELIKHVEWEFGNDENKYCAWCGEPEPGIAPEREWYDNEEDFKIDAEKWEQRGHRLDCPRQIALAEYIALRRQP